MLSRRKARTHPQRVHFTALPAKSQREAYGSQLAQMILAHLDDPDAQRLAQEYLSDCTKTGVDTRIG